MNFMLCLGHFCEIHGPTSILVTQALYPSQAMEEIPSNITNTSKLDSDSSNTVTDNAFSSVYEPESLTSSSSHCASCRLVFPQAQPNGSTDLVTSMRTIKTEPSFNSVVYLSIQYPSDPERYAVIRHSCLKILSSETTFNDYTPVVVSDPHQGTSLGIVFKVHDDMSRGHFRKYAFICHSDNEQMLMSSFMLITTHLNKIKAYIQQRAAKEYEREEVARRSSGGPEWYLRTKEKTNSILRGD